LNLRIRAIKNTKPQNEVAAAKKASAATQRSNDDTELVVACVKTDRGRFLFKVLAKAKRERNSDVDTDERLGACHLGFFGEYAHDNNELPGYHDGGFGAICFFISSSSSSLPTPSPTSWRRGQCASRCMAEEPEGK
jgi:hypothetical protein